MFEESFRQTASSYSLLESGDKVLVALSGGPDSVSLVHHLHRIAPEYDISLCAVHVNHMLRGRESDDDAAFAESLCRDLGVPAVVRRLDVPALCEVTGLGTQEAARRGRYDILVEEAHKAGAGKIAVGQNLDDQAETVLMRLFRGTGPDGLGGIWPKREIRTGDGSGLILIRPLLATSRDEIMDYIGRNNLQYRTDPSNFVPSYTRNKIRLKVMPHLREYNRQVDLAIARLAELVREEGEFLGELAGPLLERIEATETGARVPVDVLRPLSRAGRRYVTRKAIEIARGDLQRLGVDHIDAAISASLGETGAVVLPGRIRAGEQAGWAEFVVRTRPGAEWLPSTLQIPGEITIRAVQKRVTARVVAVDSLDTDPLHNTDPNVAHLDFDKVQEPVTIRKRLNGDSFCPLGMDGSKKVKDFLISLKMEEGAKNRLLVFVDFSGRVIWLGGLRIDDRFKVTRSTRSVLFLRIEDAI